ncbi:L-histidine N(alpha)-methyltransferase [Chitinophaga horti]|uniref:L-histidine N(Alpha)-methyltransferase n=1 Tax=Chitinophaga horti TaxID=2920382 RepID=A0ABY6J5E5_9BACT|nr:L-histidine N(alpha)-methyltransferase [Chitinophaga horti]UYQ93399.1 L-histidine N(alpha)-methyltransferase [Chitinophaga horti]
MKTLALLQQPPVIRKTPGQFYTDVLKGLSADNKYLDSKYFYDAAGDKLFQDIMRCPEYYLTGCELEILEQQSRDIALTLCALCSTFDVVELGAGDASKTSILLKQILDMGLDYTYFPIDISGSMIGYLEKTLPRQLPGLKVHGLNGEYIEMLKASASLTAKKRAVLFMGASIGNVPPQEAAVFLKKIREQLRPGDILITGFDLKKDPATILAAYNDAAGITREFNLNLLRRINRELGANFDTTKFEHYPIYDPGTGSCKSYLISTQEQEVHLEDACIHFAKDEAIYMEISQKYSLADIDRLAREAGFRSVRQFTDRRDWFVDAMWQSC